MTRNDSAYPHAWRYCDDVIDSFNADVSFNQFIREQLAGDLLPAKDDIQRSEQIVDTGFLALGPKSHIERNKRQFKMDLADEQIDAVSQAFLGMTVACARCHDHKFDPIPRADYYALAGIFRSTETLYGTSATLSHRRQQPRFPAPRLLAKAAPCMLARLPPSPHRPLCSSTRTRSRSANSGSNWLMIRCTFIPPEGYCDTSSIDTRSHCSSRNRFD